MNTIDLILSDLEIISKIQPQGKLKMKNNKLSLELNSSDQGIKKIFKGLWVTLSRKLRQDSREYHLLALQNLLLRIQNEIQSLKDEDTARLISHCDKSIPGLVILQNTYADDAQFVANIEMIIQNIKIIINNYK